MVDIERWRESLGDPDVKTRTEAAERLCLAGEDAATAAIGLLDACADETPVAEWAASALESLGVPNAELLPQIEQRLSSENSLVSYWAATLIGRLGESARASQQSLAGILDSSAELSTRERAAWALAQIGVSDEKVVLTLERIAGTSEARLSRLATEALKTTA